jgi:hypothetical protein
MDKDKKYKAKFRIDAILKITIILVYQLLICFTLIQEKRFQYFLKNQLFDYNLIES